jgi:hypothetical protein
MFNNRIQTSMLIVLAAVVALNVTAGLSPALAQFEFAKILASDGLEGDGFGYSVALSGDIAVIGAWFNDNHTGSAYVYRYDGLSWVQEAKLQASDGAPWDLFGWSVDISGGTVVVGAIRDADAGTFTGSAYIFRFDGSKWVEEQKLLASDYAYWDEFGFSVAISGDIAVIGAIRNDDNDPNSGSAYIFRFDGLNWVEEQKLLASDGATEDHFGNSVAISGDTAVVGAYLHDSPSNSGAAYVFSFDGSKWVEEQKLLALDTTYADHLGFSVAISGETIVVGAYGDDNADPDNIYCNSGSAYVFRFNGSSWVEEATLQVPDSECGNQFGWTVDISGDIVVIGGPDGHWGSTSGPGFAYVFDFDGSNWIRGAKLTGSDTAYGDHFGWSVGVSGGMALIGADWDDDNGIDSGSAYVFYVGAHPGDFDADGDVDLEDFAIFASAWLTESGKTGWNPDCDINVPADKSVGMLDLIVFAEHWLMAVKY